MKIPESKVRKIVREELQREVLTEDLSSDEQLEVRKIVRRELSEVFYDLFKRRGFWVDRV